MTIILMIVNAGLLISLSMVVWRLLRGPSIPDRAVASDQVSIHVVALIGLHALATNQSMLIDLVIVTAVVGFISVVMFAFYTERKAVAELEEAREEEAA